jgi:hypothetical protein
MSFLLWFLLVCEAAEFDPSSYNVKWTSSTSEPQHNIKGHPIIGGGMPVGNGDTALLVFPLTATSYPPEVPTPDPGAPTPSPHMDCTKKSSLLMGAFCEVPDAISCHDSSCSFEVDPKQYNVSAFDHDPTITAKQAAVICSQIIECVGFNVFTHPKTGQAGRCCHNIDSKEAASHF